jgi:4-hydroxy-3-methylbut-2-enyl diphosphate reductase
MEKRILKASPRGFCLGVSKAINMLEDTIKQEKDTVYVRKEIVHNAVVVERFKSLGAVFVDEVDEIPYGGVVVFSAHGVSPSVRDKAKAKNLKIIDTTCPLVTKIHKEAIRFKELGYTIILIGEAGHKEVIGVMGEAPDNIRVIQSETDVDRLNGIDDSRVAWLSQTTLNVDETQKTVERLREKYPLIQDPKSDICYATRNRQLAVKNIASECDLFIVVGSQNSSNTNKLAEVASASGAAKVLRIDRAEELAGVDFSLVGTVGITSGVSVEKDQFESIIVYLREMGYTHEEERTAVVENNISI